MAFLVLSRAHPPVALLGVLVRKLLWLKVNLYSEGIDDLILFYLFKRSK